MGDNHVTRSVDSCLFHLASASEGQEEGNEKEEVFTDTYEPAPSVDSLTPIKCPRSSKACRDNTECVLYSYVCDGEPDCKDGSDEEECQLSCEMGNFFCDEFTALIC